MNDAPKIFQYDDLRKVVTRIRDDLNDNAQRAMCVLNPLRVVLSNVDENSVELLTAPGHPNRDDMPERQLPFTREIYIDRTDFSEDSSLSRKKFKRLVLGEWVRLRGAYIIKADYVIKDSEGNVVEIQGTVVPNTVGEDAPEGIKPRGVIHWVSATECVDCEVRQYDRLFKTSTPGSGGSDFLEDINPDSLLVIAGYAVAFYFLSITLKEIPVGVAYAIWAGMGVVLVALIGWLIYGQSLDAASVIGMALIISGVVVINVFSKSVAH